MIKNLPSNFSWKLMSWYKKNKRDLPWRRRQDAYAIWISEVMLQQTRVETVIPYYHRFLQSYPTMSSLAQAEEDQVLKHWEGLGYYRRARHLQQCAKQLIADGKTSLPSTYQELIKLPGIGEYTASAIASIAYQEKTPAIDGNVLRLMSRLTEDDRDMTKHQVKQDYRQALSEVMPEDTSSFTQGLMEIGATLCLPHGKPHCLDCPFQDFCQSYQHQTIEKYPVKKQKKARRIEDKTVLLLKKENQVYIQKRSSQGLLASLYEYPMLEGNYSRKELKKYCLQQGYILKKIEKLPSTRHIFSHLEWNMQGYLLEIDQVPLTTGFWVDWTEINKQYSLPSAFQIYTEIMEYHLKKEA